MYSKIVENQNIGIARAYFWLFYLRNSFKNILLPGKVSGAHRKKRFYFYVVTTSSFMRHARSLAPGALAFAFTNYFWTGTLRTWTNPPTAGTYWCMTGGNWTSRQHRPVKFSVLDIGLRGSWSSSCFFLFGIKKRDSISASANYETLAGTGSVPECGSIDNKRKWAVLFSKLTWLAGCTMPTMYVKTSNVTWPLCPLSTVYIFQTIP